MKMKRYFAADTRQALRDLRDDQGPDAVILSTRQVEGGVEIIAALDYEDSLENAALGNPHLTMDDLTRKSSSNETGFETDNSMPPAQDGNVLSSIQAELQGLRTIMEAPMMQMAWGEMSRVQPLQARLLKQLITMGLSAQLSEALTAKAVEQGLNKNSWLDSLKLLAAIVPVADNDLLEEGGIVSLVGPTGVGKTTTIAKLAAKFALRHGRMNVNLITTDSYRIGAHEQLRTYGRILGVPVQVATDSGELANALQNVPDAAAGPSLTLIDTAGISQTDIRLAEQLATLDVSRANIQNYLVLSATGQFGLQDGVVRAFARAGLHGCILTKTDEATSLGEALSVLIKHNLKLSYVCDGQKVPDDIHTARGKNLVKEAVSLMKQASQAPSNEQLAYNFGGLVGAAHV